jgi:xanthine/CO dehydrogenase XdhC/CoxF family maturation factor
VIAALVDLELAAARRRPIRQVVLRVDFESNGRRWAAIGGGATVRDAIAAARESLPDGTWTAVSWNDLYGD